MPTVTEATTVAYAHCTNPRCPGAYQQEIEATKITTSWSFIERGGDIPGEENSDVRAAFIADEDAVCSHCEGPRDLSLNPRPQYQALSGKDPMGLLSFNGFDPRKPILAEGNAEVEALKAEMAELKEMLRKQAESD